MAKSTSGVRLLLYTAVASWFCGSIVYDLLHGRQPRMFDWAMSVLWLALVLELLWKRRRESADG
ncbi:MAG: hypothetical protein OEY20_15270 [Gemmatimonadota bacterium]|nr:hypothetical protein [Gemmatimonadota bacterium]MDH5198600.1 hypothetical protein [Gemmatimonadota bacterium]